MYIFNQIEGTVLSDDGIIAIHVFYYALKYVILCIPFLNFTLLFNKFLEIWRHNSACDSCEAFMKSACEGKVDYLYRVFQHSSKTFKPASMQLIVSRCMYVCLVSRQQGQSYAQ